MSRPRWCSDMVGSLSRANSFLRNSMRTAARDRSARGGRAKAPSRQARRDDRLRAVPTRAAHHAAARVGSLRLAQPMTEASQCPVALLHRVRIDVDLAAELPELLRHLRHALLLVVERGGVVAHVLGDLHRAELRPAHGTEMRDLVRLLRQRLVVVLARGFEIERAVELVDPAELEAGARERVVPDLRRLFALASCRGWV